MDKRPNPRPPEPRSCFSTGKKLLFSGITVISLIIFIELILVAIGTESLIEREDPSRGFSGLVSVFWRDGRVYRTRRTNEMTFNDQSFLVDKPPNGLRLFCLGGSSAHGYPRGAEAAFTAILGDVLAAAHPHRTVEAVNVAGISYAMHRLRILAEQVLQHEPDIILIYSGHNEFIEPAFFEQLKSRGKGRNRLELTLARSRTYSMFHTLIWPRTKRDPTSLEVEMDVRRSQSVLFTEPEKVAIVKEYEDGLRQIVRKSHRHGAKVLLATVPCNLREWSPEESVIGANLNEQTRRDWLESSQAGQRHFDAGEYDQAVQDLNRVAALAPTHAETQFQLGQAYEKLERWDEAREAYKRGCDFDASPIRRTSAINDSVRLITEQEEALLVDLQSIFEKASPHGLVGLNLIEDYVHPTLEGHQMIAWYLWQAIERAGWVEAASKVDRPLFDDVVASRPVSAPSTPTWFFNQAFVLEQQGQIAKAMEKYRQAIRLNPSHTYAQMRLGRLLLKGGDVSLASDHFEIVVAIDPQNAAAHNNLAASLAAQSRLDEAIDHYERAITLDPTLARYRANIANALIRKERIDEAISQYQEALRLDPELVSPHQKLATIWMAKGDQIRARSHVDQALNLDPASPLPHYLLSQLLLTEGNVSAARFHLTQAIQIRSDFVDARFLLANLLRDQGELDQAIDHYQQILGLQPENIPVLNRLGVALNMAGRRGEARNQWEQALRLDSNNISASVNLGNLMLEDEKFEEAAVIYRRVLAVDPNLAVAHNALGVVLAKQENFQEAVEHYAEALRQRPDYANAHYNLGNALRSLGRFEDAMHHFQCAIELDPNLTEVQRILQDMLESNGSDAPQCFRNAASVSCKL